MEGAEPGVILTGSAQFYRFGNEINNIDPVFYFIYIVHFLINKTTSGMVLL